MSDVLNVRATIGQLRVIKTGHSIYPWRIVDPDDAEVATFPRKRDAVACALTMEPMADWSVATANWPADQRDLVRAIVADTPGYRLWRQAVERSPSNPENRGIEQ